MCLCEADEYGGIAVHRELADEYGMIGMVPLQFFFVVLMMLARLSGSLDTTRSRPEVSQARFGFSTVPSSVYVTEKILPVSLLILPQVFAFRDRMSPEISRPLFISTTVRWRPPWIFLIIQFVKLMEMMILQFLVLKFAK